MIKGNNVQQNVDVVRAYVTASPYAHFTTFGYDLNEELRQAVISGGALRPETMALADAFDVRFTNSTDTDLVLYRVAAESTFVPFLKDDCVAYPAYMSSSLDMGAALIFLNRLSVDDVPYMMRIEYPKDSPCIDCGNLNGEKEVLLPRNIRFCVSEWKPDDYEQMKLMMVSRPVERLVLLRVAAS